MTYCLTKTIAESFKKALKDGTINPEALAGMQSKDREAFFKNIIGETDAPQVNALFEKKMLLKNIEAGFISWAKSVIGIEPAVRRGMVERIKGMDMSILSPGKREAFEKYLAEQSLGIKVTFEEAKTITRIAKTLAERKEKFNEKTEEWTNTKDRISFGLAQTDIQNFLDESRNPTNGLGVLASVRKTGSEYRKIISDKPFSGTLKVAGLTIKNLSDLSISMVASLDNSFLGRQGISVLMTHPTAWWSGAKQSYISIAKEFGGENAMHALHADILSRPNAMMGRYEIAGIIAPNEEQYPTSLPEKIPLFGRAFRMSSAAFKSSALRMRADAFDLILENAELNGVDIDSKEELKSYGMLVNSLTARGSLGKRGGSTIVKVLLWSPRMLRASFDGLTAHTFDYVKGDMTKSAYKEAGKNLFKIVAVTAAILAIIHAIYPDAVELDPTSADFGKIRIGNYRFDITGGKAGLITLAFRLLKGSSKSTTSGKVTEYGSGFGGQDRFDALIDFFTNKVTPPVDVLISLLKGRDFSGNEPTFSSIVKNLYTPLPLKKAWEFVLAPSWLAGAASLLDIHGISSNTYQNANVKAKLIPEGQKIKHEDFIKMIKVYAEAMKTDPETAFNRIFTGQTIRRVDNGAIIVERMDLSESQAIKEKGRADNPKMKLDHTIPLQLGGSNDESNLKIVTTSVWQSYTPVENHLGKLLKAGKITEKEAKNLITEFKLGNIKKEKIMAL